MMLKKIRTILLTLLFCSLTTSLWGAGLDANTSVLMDMDGSDAGTTFSDSSTNNNKGNANVTADVNTRTATKKWGTASAEFDGDSGLLSYGDDADWDVFGDNTDSWTIDMQIKFDVHDATNEIIVQRLDNSNFWQLSHIHGSGLRARLLSGGGVKANPSGGEIEDTDWHHVAWIKVADEHGIYLDGTQTAYHQEGTEATIAGTLDIGWWPEGSGYFDGYIDELRIQHSNYFEATPNDTPDDTITVPTEAYSAAAVTAGQVIIIK